MPDYSPSRSESVPARRNSSHPRDHDAASSSSSHAEAAPAPVPRRSLQFLAFAACVGFLLLQLLPATHVRHPADPSRTWIPVNPEHSAHSPITQEMLGFASGNKEISEEQTAATEFLQGIKEPTVHVFVSTKEMDLRPLLVTINSTFVNARYQHHLHFHLIVPNAVQANWLFKLKAYLDVRIEMVRDDIAFQAFQSKTAFQKTTGTEGASSSFAFLPLYIPLVYKDIKRFIYLDSHVVVQDDIEELIHIDMEGKAVSAVEDCFSSKSKFTSFKHLVELKTEEKQVHWSANELFEAQTCLTDTGVLVIDVESWNANNLTQAFEWWITELQKGGKADDRFEVLELAFQLVLRHSYKKLDAAWNVHGLARDKLTELERDYLEKIYFRRPDKRPFLSPKADHAKLLQFSGMFKPWSKERTDPSQPPISLCGTKAKECASFWWKYLSPHANEFLQPHTNLLHV